MKEILNNIIKNGEKIDTEFKLAYNKLPKNLFETICAFLNRFGGNIILGVDDEKNIIGVEKEFIVQMKKDFATLCNNPQKIYPTIYLQIDDYEIDGKTILYINVPDSSEVHRCNGRIFDRNQDGDFDITDNTYLVSGMYIRKRDIHVEDKIYPTIQMEELNYNVFETARGLIQIKNKNHPWLHMSNEEIVKSAGLYRKDEETGKEGLTLAAILLFGKDETIMSCLSHFKTDAIYRNENMERYDDRDVIITNLIDSYTRLMNFVRKHTNDKFYLNEETHLEGVRDEIAREICVNLLIHRELSDGTTSRIIITKDNIYTENPSRAKLRGFININNYVPYSKNPRIAKVFREIGLADELGSGVRNITKYTRIYSGKNPILEDGDIFRVVIPLNKAQDVAQDKAQDVAQDKTSELIIRFCKEEKNIFEIMEHLGYKNRTRFRRSYIKPLVENGKLQMTIPEKPTSKNQKYVAK